MQIQELFDIDKFIKLNDLKEVKTQSLYSPGGLFNPDGLLSEEIFGQTETSRWYRCGYIKLPFYIFNPSIAKIISRSGGIIKKMAYSEIKCNIEDGVLVERPDGDYSGFRDLYKIWDQINIEKTLKTRSTENLTILTKSPKRLIFSDKILVLPPNFRPIGMKNGKQTRNELNTIYMHILGLRSITSHTTNSVHEVCNKIQDSSISIYNYIQNYVSAKGGFFQKSLLAKNSLWTARNVISAPRYDKEDTPIGLFTTGYPLHTVCSMFKPLVKFQMKQFLSFNNIQQIHPNPNEIKSSEIANLYDDEAIETLINIYMQNPGSRFKILYLDTANTKPIIFNAINLKDNSTISRPLTLTDAIYLCCHKAVVVPNRMVYTVRYPIGDYLGAFFTQVHVLSTVDTMGIRFLGETFKYYPIINPELPHSKVSTLFADTLTPSNSRLPQWNGDYDGDTVKSVGIFTDEANEEARNLMYSNIENIKPENRSIFKCGKECVLGLYGLTRMD